MEGHSKRQAQGDVAAIERGLGIHRGTIKKYLDAEGSPSRHHRVDPSEPSSDAVAAYRVTYMLKT